MGVLSLEGEVDFFEVVVSAEDFPKITNLMMMLNLIMKNMDLMTLKK